MLPRIACLLAILVLASTASAVGNYGAPVSGTTAGVVGVLRPFATAQIGFLDNNPADGQLGSSEAVVLTFFNDGALHVNDVILSNPTGSGLTGAVGSLVQTPPAGTVDYTIGATTLNSLLRFVDVLPSLANGGPDGRFNPGEALFLDTDQSGTATAADRLLVSGEGLTGTLGAAPTHSESVWALFNECIYVSTDSTADAGDTLVSVDTAGNCPTLPQPGVAVSGVLITARTVADAATTAASTTVTSPGGAFIVTDAGKPVTGAGIPAGTTIATFTDANTVVLSQAATATAAGITLSVGTTTTFEPTEEAYIGTGSTVSTGMYRVTTTAGGAAGTLVECGTFGSDADCGQALFGLASTIVTQNVRTLILPTPAAPNANGNGFSFFDANGNNLFDGNDGVLLDLDQNGFSSPADVRVSSSAGQTFGTRPALADATVAAFPSLALTPTIVWLDQDNNNQVETGEPIGLSITGTVLDIGDLCLTAVGGCAAGAQRTGASTEPGTGGAWKAVSTANNPGTLGFEDLNNNNVYDRGDNLYLHFGAVPGNVAAGDLLLASDAGATGARVTAPSGALKAFAATFRAFDADGSGTYSIGDIIYVRGGAFTDATPGTIRLNSAPGLTGFGKNLAVADADAVLRLLDPGAANFLFGFRDLDGTNALSNDDSVYLLARATNCPLQGPDVLLSPGLLTAAAGSFVGVDTAVCTNVGGSPQFGFSPTGVYSTSSSLFVDLDGDSTIEVGDIRLTAGTAGSGSRVTSTSSGDLNSPITAIAVGSALGTRTNTVEIMVIDASGDGIAAAQETVVLDIDGDGYLTPGDVPLSGTGTTGTGTTGGGGGGGGGGTSGGGTGSSAIEAVAAANADLATTVIVTRIGDDNIVDWDPQAGVSGYQVWRSTSPFTLVATLTALQTEFRDNDGPAQAIYVVTAFISMNGVDTGKMSDINAEQVLGNSDLRGAVAPAGTGTPTTGAPTTTQDGEGGSDGTTPLPAWLAVAVLAFAAVAGRRRT